MMSANDAISNPMCIIAPMRDSGKLMLISGNELWFYDSQSRPSVRLSPQQHLLGQAASGVVATVDLIKGCQAQTAAEEHVQGSERQSRHSLKLLLTAKNTDVAYDRVGVWVDTADGRPIKARFYTGRGLPLRTACHRRFQSGIAKVEHDPMMRCAKANRKTCYQHPPLLSPNCRSLQVFL